MISNGIDKSEIATAAPVIAAAAFSLSSRQREKKSEKSVLCSPKKGLNFCVTREIGAADICEKHTKSNHAEHFGPLQ